jgi:hypothetical protein
MTKEQINDMVYEFYQENKLPFSIRGAFDIEDYYSKGIIKGGDLEDGKYYIGKCRNSNIGKWNEEKKVMRYMRSKFGSWFVDEINYLDNDDGYDLFVAIQGIEESEVPEEYLIKE